MIDEIEERNQAQRELQQLVDAVPQHIVVLSGDGSRVYANQAACDYHGLTSEQFLAEPITNCFHSDDIQNYSLIRNAAIANGEPWEAEARLRRNDGLYRWFLIRGKPLRNDQGAVVRWYLTRTDIEDRKQAEKDLQRLVDAVPQHILMHSVDGRRLYANQVTLDFLGWTLEDFLDNKKLAPFHPDDLARFLKTRQHGISVGKPFELEARLRRNDGQYRWFLIKYNPHRNEQGEIAGWYSTGTDIEDRKQAERELRQLVDAVPHFMTVLSGEGRRLHVNKVGLDFFGWTLDDFFDDRTVKRAFHPEDLDGYLECRQRGIKAGEPFQIEARICRKDGQYRWYLLLYNPYRNEQGQIVRWYATGTDIEDRTQTENALQRSEARLRLLLEFTNKLITKLDLRELLHAVAPSLRKVIACDLIAVFLPHPDGETLRSFVIDFPGGKGFLREEHSTQTQPISLGKHPLAEMVFRTGKEWVGNENDVLQLGFKNAPPLAEGLKAGCVLPILCCDRVLGVLGLGRLESKPFDAYEVDLLRQVADQVAIAIVNAVAVEDRKQAEEALRRSESYLAEAQRLSHTGSWAWDYHKKEITHWSPETYRVFGFDTAGGPVTWEKARSRIHPDDLEAFDRNKEQVATERIELEFDFRLVHPDGVIKYAHCVSRPVIDASSELVELVGSIMDVTEQYHSRTALEKAFQEIKQLKDELYRENLALKEEIDQASMFEEIVGTSQALRRVLGQVAKVAPTDSTVLVTGETGTGKELIARAIHRRSGRSSRAFVTVNCAAIPQALIGSELFGHERGAFTGATQRRLGRFELADGGTLFLDEVGDLPAETQIALLRVLQERQFERIGGTQPITVDVRIIAATNRDLKSAVSAGTFRSDLFYRLNVFPIEVPPLRERKDDIPLLVEYLTERYASKAGKKIKSVQKGTLDLFQSYDWPGNIRELQNVIERAVILCENQTFFVDESWLQAESPRPASVSNGLARLGAERERELIESALAETKGRIAGPLGAAAKLGIPRSTLETKIRKLGIKKHNFHAV
jgi:PAS domain S-box-containing protein